MSFNLRLIVQAPYPPRKYDVIETSYHFYSDRIDLHFCDDPGGGRSDHPELAGGGAFQVFIN